jgi:hypothetical protein
MKRVVAGALALGLVVFLISRASANGTETLGPASIPIATGTGIAAGGVGLANGPGLVTLEVPAGATVKQVLLYWEGFMADNSPGDDSVNVAKGGPAQAVSGTLIGGPTQFFGGAWASTYRADITGLGLVTPGLNAVTISGLDFTAANNGAGIMAIYDDGSSNGLISVRDGSDLAFIGFAPPLDTTVQQVYTFPAATGDRTANIHMFFASVAGTLSGFGIRPTAIELKTNGPGGGTTVLNNVLDSVNGEEWDYFTIAVDIPAGSTSLSVQVFSRDDLGIGGLPASLDWLAAGFSIEPDVPPNVPGRMTGGGSVFTIDDVRVTRGFEIHCDLREPNNIEVNWSGGKKFHLTELTSAVCIDSPAVQAPPNAPFDTFIGTGVGKYGNETGARIEFVFVDAGEPGTSDTAHIKVYDASNVLVLDVPGSPALAGFLDKGNIQAHKDNQSLF